MLFSLRCSLQHVFVLFSFPLRRSSALSAFSRRTFATEAITPNESAKIGSTTGWFERNAVGVTLILGIGAAAVSAVRADVTAAKAEQKATESAKDLKDLLEAEKAVLKAQADSVKAQADSVKTQAWAAYLFPTLTSLGALSIAVLTAMTNKK